MGHFYVTTTPSGGSVFGYHNQSSRTCARRYLDFKVKTEGIKIKHQSDGIYYNITGIEITFDSDLQIRLVEWGQATEGYVLTIQRAKI